jgi:hypothetical protein
VSAAVLLPDAEAALSGTVPHAAEHHRALPLSRGESDRSGQLRERQRPGVCE